MIGIMLLFSLTGGLAISGLLGAAGIIIHRKSLVAGSGGSWPLFWVIAVAVAALLAWLIATHLLMKSGKWITLTADDLGIAMKAAFLLGVAPGTGMLAGALVAFFK